MVARFLMVAVLLSGCTKAGANLEQSGGKGAEQAVSIPGAVFTEGSGRAPDEPLRRVTLSAYRIDRTEVSVAAFERFVGEGWSVAGNWSADGLAWRKTHPTGAGAALRLSGRPATHPVVAVTWFEAEAYCRWNGGRLPSEAEWEHGACHAEGERYPWGNEEPAAGAHAEPVAPGGLPDAAPGSVAGGPAWFTEGKWGQITAVRTHAVTDQDPAFQSPFGLLDMAGNVWEWTRDSYAARAYEEGPATDPVGTAPGLWKVLRGGSFMNLPSYCTCTHREPARPDQVRLTAGFRCAYEP
jgi:formylglycine-generating enzyme